MRVGERIVVVVSESVGVKSQAFVTVGLFRPTIVEMERVAIAPFADLQAMTGIEGATALAVGLPRGASPGSRSRPARAEPWLARSSPSF